MRLKNQNAGETYIIKDVPEKMNCENCDVCMRLRLMELGLMPGSIVQLNKHQAGLWIVSLLSKSGTVESTIALREEEAERVILEDEACSINFEPYR